MPDRAARLTLSRADLRRALAEGRRAAELAGGSMSVAAVASGWTAPVVLGPRVAFRLWSTSKAVAAVTLLTQAAKTRQAIREGVRRSMMTALSRSDNCAERRVVLALQQVSGTSANAESNFRDVLRSVGAHPEGSPLLSPFSDATACMPWLRDAADGLADTELRAPTLELGTNEWTVEDAVRFAFGLGTGAFGAAGRPVVGWMQLPKALAEGEAPAAYTSPFDLPPAGGRFPRSWHPAYKGGWGGSQQHDYITEQIVILHIEGNVVALAAMFRPDVQPSVDNPGGTVAPAALEDVFASARAALQKAEYRASVA